jgi:hypothetical protein
MSTTHPSPDALRRFRRRETRGEELAATLQHLSECPQCRTEGEMESPASDASAVRRHFTGSPENGHLDFETQLVPYVEETVDVADVEIIETHLEDCARCRADLEDLRKTRAQFHQRTPAPRRAIPIRVLAQAAVLAVVLGTWFLWPRGADTPPPPESPAVRQTPIPARPAPEAPVRTRYADPLWQQLVDTAVARRSLPSPSHGELNPSADTLRGPSAAPSPNAEFSPAGQVIRDSRPAFTWPSREGASYSVLIYAGRAEAARSPWLTAPRWTPPDALQRGRTYTWQVIAKRSGVEEALPSVEQPLPRFRITSAEEEETIGRALKAHPDDYLLHAVLYAKAGLADAANAALHKAAQSGNADARAIRDRREKAVTGKSQ